MSEYPNFREVIYMAYFSKIYELDVRESIAKEFTNLSGEVDDMMAGLLTGYQPLRRSKNWK